VGGSDGVSRPEGSVPWATPPPPAGPARPDPTRGHSPAICRVGTARRTRLPASCRAAAIGHRERSGGAESIGAAATRDVARERANRPSRPDDERLPRPRPRRAHGRPGRGRRWRAAPPVHQL